jgi:hypothetical protein
MQEIPTYSNLCNLQMQAKRKREPCWANSLSDFSTEFGFPAVGLVLTYFGSRLLSLEIKHDRRMFETLINSSPICFRME